MSLAQTTNIEKIEVVANGVVQVKEVTVITNNGQEVARTAHRYSLVPGQDIANQPANVQAICTAAWTPQIVSDYQSLVTQ
jgi:hypothetical protein